MIVAAWEAEARPDSLKRHAKLIAVEAVMTKENSNWIAAK